MYPPALLQTFVPMGFPSQVRVFAAQLLSVAQFDVGQAEFKLTVVVVAWQEVPKQFFTVHILVVGEVDVTLQILPSHPKSHFILVAAW